MTAFLSSLLRFLLLVWLLFAASPLPALTWGYDAQTRHVSTGYDVRSLLATDYDSASTLLTNVNEHRSVETGGSFAHFAEFLATKSGTQLARELGAAGEQMSGIVGPKNRIPSLTGTANYRVPDELIPNMLLRDAKNVGELRVTPQLIDFGQYSQQNNLRFILDVRQNTVIGPSAQQFIDQYGVQINRIYPGR